VAQKVSHLQIIIKSYQKSVVAWFFGRHPVYLIRAYL